MAIDLQNVSFKALGREIVAPLTTGLKKGKITAIVGPNGSGKSSLLKMLAGEVKSTQGHVNLQGKPLHKWSKKALAGQLSILPQSSPRPSGMRVYDLVACGRYPHTGAWKRFSRDDHDAVMWALQRTDLLHFEDARIDHLSGGEMQRVWLAMVLCQKTPVILLDEPTSYLDISHQLQLLQIVRDLNVEEQITVAWVLHDLNQAMQFSDEIWVMQQGKRVRSGCSKTALDKDLLRDVFAIECEFIEVAGSPIIVPYQASGHRCVSAALIKELSA